MTERPRNPSSSPYRVILDRMVHAYQNVPVLGVTFSAPYWMNKITGEIDTCVCGPYNGKATAFQISILVEHALADNSDEPELSILARRYCESHHIGIDCSGFIFFVLSEFLQFEQRSNFPWKKQRYPEDILNGIDGTGRLRRVNANVLTSIHNGVSVSPDDVRFGDLVRIRDGSHVAIVREVMETSLIIAHSSSEGPNNGVTFSPIARYDDEISFWRLNALEKFCD